MLELELKAVVPDPAALQAQLRASGAVPQWHGMMRDRRLDRDGAPYTARDEVVRVRAYEGPAGASTVLGWKGPTMRTPEGYKAREELEFEGTGDSIAALRLLEALGFHVVHAIDRRIEIWSFGDATLRLEWYPRMDVLLEVEGPADALEAAIVASGLPRDTFTTDTLNTFAARYRDRTGLPSAVSEGELRGADPLWGPAA